MRGEGSLRPSFIPSGPSGGTLVTSGGEAEGDAMDTEVLDAYGRDAWRRPARRRRRGRGARRVLRAALAVATLVAICALAVCALGLGRGLLSGAVNVPGALVGRTSTPRDQWRAGEVPYLYQTDAEWAGEPYAGSTVGEAGCGPTCLTMAYVGLTGRTDSDPADMCRMSEERGHVMDGMTAWSLMGEGASWLGLSSREVPADAGSLLAELAAGRPVIASVGPGDFTSSGHFVVISGVAGDGRLVVHDPNSVLRSSRTWDVDRVLGQCANLWSFSHA